MVPTAMKNFDCRRLFLLGLIFIVVSGHFFAGGSRTSDQDSNPGVLSLGLMPAVDILPILAAQDLNYFAEEGVEVEIQIYTSAQDRQSALQAAAIDGALTDLVALALNVENGFPLVGTTATQGMFMILQGEDKDRGNRPSVGLMEVSVTNFLTDQWIGGQYDLEKVYINDLGARLEAVVNGQTDLGIFPEPLASIGVARGLRILATSENEGFSPQILVFTAKAIEEKIEAVRAFHRAYNRGVDAMNADSELALDLLYKYIPNINPAVRDQIRLPVYSLTSLPTDSEIAQVIRWTSGIVGKTLTVSPGDLVDRSFPTGP